MPRGLPPHTAQHVSATGPDTPGAACWEAWRHLLGEEHVFPGAAAERYRANCLGAEPTLAGALRPADTEQVAGLTCIAAEARVPLYPISSGRNWGYGSAVPPRDGCVLVDLSRLTGIAVDAAGGLATLGPGVTQGLLHEHLETHGLDFLVPTTGAGPGASLVGNALERGYGITPHADHFGAVMALTAVLADGSVYRSPLAEAGALAIDRGHKWGVGPYLDGLFAQGAFGIVTEMTIALAPRPERVTLFTFQIDGDDGLASVIPAVGRLKRALGGLLGGLNLMSDRRMLAMVAPYPHGHVPPGEVMAPRLAAGLARLEGVPAWTGLGAVYGPRRVVAAACVEVRRALEGRVRMLVFADRPRLERLDRIARRIPGGVGRRLAERLRRARAGHALLSGRPGETALELAYWRRPPEVIEASSSVAGDRHPIRDGCAIRWYAPLVPIDPGAVRCFVDLVRGTAPRFGIEPLITLTTVSDHCFDSTVPLIADTSLGAAPARACYEALLAAGADQGFLPYRVPVDAMAGLIALTDGPYWRMVGSLKAAVDPHGIIAPGRYCPD